MSKKLTAGDWYEAYLGIPRSEGYPLKSISRRGRAATSQEIATVTDTVRPLADDSRIKVGPINSVETTIQIMKPLACIASVKCFLY